jgi:hypothetical protein
VNVVERGGRQLAECLVRDDQRPGVGPPGQTPRPIAKSGVKRREDGYRSAWLPAQGIGLGSHPALFSFSGKGCPQHRQRSGQERCEPQGQSRTPADVPVLVPPAVLDVVQAVLDSPVPTR